MSNLGGSTGTIVNDVHSGLNETSVHSVMRPASAADVQALVTAAAACGQRIAICGGRHAMGGQQFGAGLLLLDMRRMDKVLCFDRENGLLEAEAGIQWPALIDFLADAAEGDGPSWSIRQKQTGADSLSLGGCLSANVHGRGLRMRPFISDVEAFTLVDAQGRLLQCSRGNNPRLFRLAIGGYGLFGVIASVTLRLAPLRKMRRDVTVLTIDTLMDAFAQRIGEGYNYGDFQFAIDPDSADFMHRGVFSCYCPVADDTPVGAHQLALTEGDWRTLLALAHTDKSAAFAAYSRHYLATSGQVCWSDRLQQSTYLDGYHKEIDCQLGQQGSEMIGELYVPRDRLADFMRDAAEDFRAHAVNLIYGTIRLIERDDESFMPWARQDYACVIFNLHTEHSADGIESTGRAFRRLIAMAILRGGSYYLTYHRYASLSQVQACYPGFAGFLRWKRRYDPRERFSSDWYVHYRDQYLAYRAQRGPMRNQSPNLHGADGISETVVIDPTKRCHELTYESMTPSMG